MSEATRNIPLYSAGAMQMACQAVNGLSREDAIEVRKQTLAKIRNYVSVNKMFVQFYNGSNVKVMVLPEYILSGFLLGESHEEWHHKACIEYDGFEYEDDLENREDQIEQFVDRCLVQILAQENALSHANRQPQRREDEHGKGHQPEPARTLTRRRPRKEPTPLCFSKVRRDHSLW